MKINSLSPLVWALFALSGCVGDAPALESETQLLAAEPAECAKTENDFIRLKLAKNCVSCHGEGAVAPYFASAEAFEGLLVQNPRLVIPGDPDGSELVKLLEGNGTGAFSQMPTAGPDFAAIPEADRDISIEEIRAWITGLQLGVQDVNPDREAPTTRRIGADELRNSLMSQLGLSFEDDFVQQLSSNFDSPTMVLRGPLPLRPTDDAPGLHYGDQKASTSQRWSALGGANWLQRKPRTFEISPSFLQTLTQVSQAWCEMAVNKPDNTALFQGVSPTDGSDVAEEAIKANIAYLHLRMLGIPATDGDVTKIYDDVFVAHEEAGPKTSWVAVCSYFVRNPLWLSL